MSRKNRNAARCKYDRVSYAQGSLFDKSNVGASAFIPDNSNANRSGSIEETTMINERGVHVQIPVQLQPGDGRKLLS